MSATSDAVARIIGGKTAIKSLTSEINRLQLGGVGGSSNGGGSDKYKGKDAVASAYQFYNVTNVRFYNLAPRSQLLNAISLI